MITIIFAPPRTGKTSLMSHLLNGFAYDRARYRLMRDELECKNGNGFNLTVPSHPVSANYSLQFRNFGYTRRRNRMINPFRLGFENEHVDTHFNYPYEVIGITEAQKYLNSRLSLYYPDWQSRWYEQHGHNSIDIFLDTQRPMLIDVNIRELACFIEVQKMVIKRDGNDKIKTIKWYIRRIENCSRYDRYMASGKTDKSCYDDDVIVANYNVFDIYDHQLCKPKFYSGRFDKDFDISLSEEVENTPEGYIKFLERFDDELPEGFYQKRSKA